MVVSPYGNAMGYNNKQLQTLGLGGAEGSRSLASIQHKNQSNGSINVGGMRSTRTAQQNQSTTI